MTTYVCGICSCEPCECRDATIKQDAAWLEAENRKWGEKLAPVPRPWPINAIAVYRNNAFLVQIFEEANTLRMTVNRTELLGWDGERPLWKDGITWDELQRLKAEAGFGNRWAVEIFPPDDRIVNVANMRHLFLLDGAPSFAWRK